MTVVLAIAGRVESCAHQRDGDGEGEYGRKCEGEFECERERASESERETFASTMARVRNRVR